METSEQLTTAELLDRHRARNRARPNEPIYHSGERALDPHEAALAGDPLPEPQGFSFPGLLLALYVVAAGFAVAILGHILEWWRF